MTKIRVAIVGVGNCASALVQGIHYYADRDPAKVSGVMRWSIGRYFPSDIEIAAEFDVDRRKVGKDVTDAIRCCKLALDRREGGMLSGPSAYFCKHPPQQYNGEEAYKMTEGFIAEGVEVR